MRLSVFLGAFLLLAGYTGAQSRSSYPYKITEYIDAFGQKLPSEDGAHHRIERTFRDSLSGSEKLYNAAGKLTQITPYADMAHLIKLGPQTTFYETGQLRTKEDFVGAQRNGEFLVFYPEGKHKRREIYMADKRQSGNCFAPDGSPVAFYEYEKMPTYKGGGTNKLTQDIAANVRYPAEALRAQTQGKVFVTFQVGVNGQVEDIKVLKGISAALDAAAIAAVKKLGVFDPGTQDGEPVAVSFTIPVTFSITEAPPIYRSPNQNTGFPSSGSPY